MDLFSTNYLMGVVQDLKVPPSWALGRFFGRVVQDESEEIHFDIVDAKRRIAPLVSPKVPGRLMDDVGREVRTFKPAYVKDKRAFDASRPFKRAVGETIGGSLSPQQRQQLAIVETLDDQLKLLDRRQEVMSVEALRTGKLVLVGENYPETTVDFKRDAALSPAALTGAGVGTSPWTHANADPLKNLRDWALLCVKKGGAWPVDVVMAVDVFDAFINHAKVSAKWNSVNGNMQGTIVAGRELTEGGVFMGSIEGFNVFVYAGWYIKEDGNEAEILPANWLFMASPQVEGVRAYGAIKDLKSLQAVPYFVKSYEEDDPSEQIILMQSAPLMVPTRPNVTFGRQVVGG